MPWKGTARKSERITGIPHVINTTNKLAPRQERETGHGFLNTQPIHSGRLLSIPGLDPVDENDYAAEQPKKKLS